MRTYCFRKILSVVLIALCSTSISALQPLKGYRGFVDSDNFLGINPGFLTGDGGPSTIYTGFTTSHGHQFNPWLYVGGGDQGLNGSLGLGFVHGKNSFNLSFPVF